ncbi:hypothetical protein Golax_008860, partial [Gossypium laxum]|nr:hypothetical protein [Gossypium laxum]
KWIEEDLDGTLINVYAPYGILDNKSLREEFCFERFSKKFMVDCDFSVMLDHVTANFQKVIDGFGLRNVALALKDEAGCGGVLRDDKGSAQSQFEDIHKQGNGMEDALVKADISWHYSCSCLEDFVFGC